MVATEANPDTYGDLVEAMDTLYNDSEVQVIGATCDAGLLLMGAVGPTGCTLRSLAECPEHQRRVGDEPGTTERTERGWQWS